MSVIAWDGKTLAADKQCTNGGMRYECSKMRQLADGTVLAVTGHMDSALMVIRWFEDGADPERWPATQSDAERWSRLIVLSPSGELSVYERCPVKEQITAVPLAWGSGADYAMGAMAMGADARQAVVIASTYSEGCGLGVDAFNVASDDWDSVPLLMQTGGNPMSSEKGPIVPENPEHPIDGPIADPPVILPPDEQPVTGDLPAQGSNG